MPVTLYDAHNNPTVLHVGCVISHHPTTVHVHSDNAMLDSGNRMAVTLWDAASQQIATYNYHTDDCHLEVVNDATPEVWAAFSAHQHEQAAKLKAIEDAKAAAEASKPHKGDTVTVIKAPRGHKDYLGESGRVFWEGKCAFKGTPRIGFETNLGRKIFLGAEFVEKVTAESAAECFA